MLAVSCFAVQHGGEATRLTAPSFFDAPGFDSSSMPASEYGWHQLPVPSGRCLDSSLKTSQLHADQWALEVAEARTGSCLTNGFYVDVGSNNGYRISNTYPLDVYQSWSGLCIDPFPTNMTQRTCSLAQAVVLDVDGQEVSFEHSDDEFGVMGGVADIMSGHDKGSKSSSARTYHFKTSTRSTGRRLHEPRCGRRGA
jgi:hypothetical protein